MKSEVPNPSLDTGRELMSALADGQADAAAGVAAWSSDPQAREAWHTYQLIGDVLRSEDLARRGGHDAAFVARLRDRLTREPAIVAPLPAAVVPRAVRRRWAAPAAVAAGFAAVAGVLVVLRQAPMADAGPSLVAAVPAASAPAALLVAADARSPAASEPPLYRVDGNLIRDARLDGYLRAHRGGAIGRFETVVLER